MTRLKITSYGVTVNITCDNPEFLIALDAELQLLPDNFPTQSEFSVDISFQKIRPRTWFFFKGILLGFGLSSDFAFVTGNQDVVIRRNRNQYLIQANDTETTGEAIRLLLYSEWIWRIGKLRGWLPIHAMAYQTKGLGHLVIGKMCAGKSNLAKNIVLHTEHQLLGDELIWYDGKYLYPFCTTIRYRTKGLKNKLVLEVPKTRVGSAAELVSVDNLSSRFGAHDFWDLLLNFVIFMSGAGLPQMLVLNLHPRRLLSATCTAFKRLKLALMLTLFVRNQKRITKVANLLPSATYQSER